MFVSKQQIKVYFKIKNLINFELKLSRKYVDIQITR